MNSKKTRHMLATMISIIILLQLLPVSVSTLYASNHHTATIVFHGNGGTGAPRQKNVIKDNAGAAWFSLPTQTPQRTGHQFVGWRILNSTSEDYFSPGEKVGLTSGRRGQDATFVYLAIWKSNTTHTIQADSFDAADLMRRGHCYCEMQDIMEMEVVRLVNEIRAEYGLDKLPVNPQLAELARERAQESADHGYISGHISHETGLSHTDHAKAKGLDVEFAGENWGGNQRTPQDVVDAWMASPGHRDFLLSGHETSRFESNTYIGVGVAFCRDGGFISDKNWILWQMR